MQKEETPRLASMKNQILVNSGVAHLPAGYTGVLPGHLPICLGEKAKPQSEAAGENKETMESLREIMSKVDLMDKGKSEELQNVENPQVAENEVEQKGDDDSWDVNGSNNAYLKLPGKNVPHCEEVNSEPELVPETEMKIPQPAIQDIGDPLTTEILGVRHICSCNNQLKSQNFRNMKVTPKVKVICESKGQQGRGGEEDLKAGAFPARVKQGEAGGIAQHIGATYFPSKNVNQRSRQLKADEQLKVLGLLVMEASVDRLYGWTTCCNAPIVKAIRQQQKDVQFKFNMSLTQIIITQFKEQGINTKLFYNKSRETKPIFNIVPTSLISCEGLPDLLLLLVQWTHKCAVLDVKAIERHGTTIDVVLINSVLCEGDQIVVSCMKGPIVTAIRALLTPHPTKEEAMKGIYLCHEEIKAAYCIKIAAEGLQDAIASISLYIIGPDDELEDIKEVAMEDMRFVMNKVDKGDGICVQGCSLGSLEWLLKSIKTPTVCILISGVGLGAVHKKDVRRASSMLAKKKEYATILPFDVGVTPGAQELADEVGVKIFYADIIEESCDQFKAYTDNVKKEKKDAAEYTVIPSVHNVIPNYVSNEQDHINLDVGILEGMPKDYTTLLCNDIWVCILSSLDNPRDIITISAVSKFFHDLVVNNHLCKELCLKLFPELGKLCRIKKWKISCEHQLFSCLFGCMLKSDIIDCILEGVCASSTSVFPEKSIWKTLGPKFPLPKAGYWSSAGQKDPKVPITLIYQLSARFCIVEELLIEPYLEHMEDGDCSLTKSIILRMGFERVPHCDVCLPSRKDLHGEFEWTHAFGAFTVTGGNQIRINLPRPVLCIGGFIEIELSGLVQKKLDGLFYCQIYLVRIFGRPLWDFQGEIFGSSSTSVLTSCKLLALFVTAL